MAELRPCLLIPIYDNRDTIRDVVESLAGFGLPCLIVDDGSGPETREVLAELVDAYPWVQVERLPVNAGRGAALERGYRSAAGRGFTHVIQLDADGQHAAADIPAFIESAREKPEAMVLGDPQFDASAPAGRRYGRQISRFWVWVETFSFDIHDPLCGFRCLPLRPLIETLDRVSCGKRMEFDAAILVRLYWAGVPVCNLPTCVAYFEDGLSHFDLLWDNVRISLMHTRLVLAMLLRLPSRWLVRCAREGRCRVNEASSWHEERERGSTLGIRIVAWAYRWMGRAVARLLVYPVVSYFFLTDRTGRHASLRYLQHVYAQPNGREALGTVPGPGLVFRHFLSFGFTILDRLAFWIGERGGMRVSFHGEEHLLRIVDAGCGGILLGAHIGCFDAMRAIAKRSPKAINVLMYTAHADRINSVLRSLSGEVDLRVISIQPGSIAHVFELKACIARGEFVAILGDRVAPGEAGRVVRVPFLGEEADFPIGPIAVAGLLGCPVLLVGGLRTRDGGYEVTAEPFTERVVLPRAGRREAIAKYCEEYVRWIERRCYKAPLQWFNFYDFWELKR